VQAQRRYTLAVGALVTYQRALRGARMRVVVNASVSDPLKARACARRLRRCGRVFRRVPDPERCRICTEPLALTGQMLSMFESVYLALGGAVESTADRGPKPDHDVLNPTWQCEGSTRLGEAARALDECRSTRTHREIDRLVQRLVIDERVARRDWLPRCSRAAKATVNG